jgi:hypothetical protein
MAAVAIWIFVALFWVGVFAKHHWMKDETRAQRTKDWDYPVLDRAARILDWVFAPLVKRHQKKIATQRAKLGLPSMAQERIELITGYLTEHGIRHRVETDDAGNVTYLVHKDDEAKLAALLDMDSVVTQAS